MDAARIRAKQERASRTPGPGSYNPKLSAGANEVRPAPSPTLSKTLLDPRGEKGPKPDTRVPRPRSQNAGSAAFKSSTKRDKAAELGYMGDPGAYDAYSANDLAQSATKSYAKSMQAGTGGFGSSAPARAPLSVAGDAAAPDEPSDLKSGLREAQQYQANRARLEAEAGDLCHVLKHRVK